MAPRARAAMALSRARADELVQPRHRRTLAVVGGGDGAGDPPAHVRARQVGGDERLHLVERRVFEGPAVLALQQRRAGQRARRGDRPGPLLAAALHRPLGQRADVAAGLLGVEDVLAPADASDARLAPPRDDARPAQSAEHRHLAGRQLHAAEAPEYRSLAGVVGPRPTAREPRGSRDGRRYGRHEYASRPAHQPTRLPSPAGPAVRARLSASACPAQRHPSTARTAPPPGRRTSACRRRSRSRARARA